MINVIEKIEAVKSFDELNALVERGELTSKEEKAYINKCYELYEKIGFADIFQFKDSDYRHYNGLKFKILKSVSVNDNRYDLEVLPMWHIQLSNGVYADAYPEEIVVDF